MLFPLLFEKNLNNLSLRDDIGHSTLDLLGLG